MIPLPLAFRYTREILETHPSRNQRIGEEWAETLLIPCRLKTSVLNPCVHRHDKLALCSLYVPRAADERRGS